MATTMWFGVLAFAVLFVGLLLIEWSILNAEQRISKIQRKMDGDV